MKCYIAADHAGFALKEEIKQWLKAQQIAFEDLGTFDTQRVDYPLYAQKLAQRVLADSAFGILICGSGIGMSIAANRFTGIRAALCHDAYTAEVARLHNDANVLCLGARVLGFGIVESILHVFFQTTFEGGRHEKRIALMDAIQTKE